MITFDEEYTQEVECVYKEETYKVRDNGAIMRLPKNGKVRPSDNNWTFGRKNQKNGYLFFGSNVRVHQIVATAFHGEPDDPQKVVDHKDTNRCNNRPENLQWVTKLENILLNENTRSKIEFLCGSIEKFLENPQLLNSHLQHDRNFEWMITVTKEEAANTLLHWKELFSNQQNAIRANSMGLGEFMYETSKPQKKVEYSQPQIGTTKEQAPFVSTTPVTQYRRGRVVKTEEQKREERRLKARERKLRLEQEKRDFEQFLSDTFEKLTLDGFTITKQAVVNNYCIDLLIENKGNRYAIFFNSDYDYLKEINFKNEHITCCWITKNNRASYLRFGENPLQPSFSMEDGEVIVPNNKNLKVIDFIKLFINDRIVKQKQAKIKYIYLSFWEQECYKCHDTYDLYYVNAMSSDMGAEFYNDCEINDMQFMPEVVEAVTKFHTERTEFESKLATVEGRYSNMMGETYTSFGCPHCDAIYGSFYYQDYKLDLCYEDLEDLVKIDVSNRNIVLPVSHWCILQ